MIFVISGPSGCGKSTLIARALEDLKGLQFSVSHTTRKRRDTEAEGREYYFVSPEKFKWMIKEGRFVEWALVHGNYYGTSRREIEKKSRRGDLVLDIDVQGARQVRQKSREPVFVFILPPHFDVLKKRLEDRGENNADSIRRRLRDAGREIKEYRRFDYIVVNDDLEEAVRELEAIIVSRRLCLAVHKKDIRPILESFAQGTALLKSRPRKRRV